MTSVLLDPYRFAVPTTNTLQLPGTTGNYASTPDSAATSITGDIDIRCKVALTDWTDATTPALVSKWTDAGTQGSYVLRMRADATIGAFWYVGGLVSVSTSAIVTFADGTAGWIRVTRATATGDSTFYKSSDGVTWTQVGTVRPGTAGNLPDNTAAVNIGAYNAGATGPLNGKVYYAEIRNGIGGSVVASFNATAVVKTGTRTPTTYTAPTGEVWTVNGSTWDWVGV